MAVCHATPTVWKGRRGYVLSNGVVELTLLLGGGHLVDFRLCGSPCNVLFESPWTTIDPSEFVAARDAGTYGEGPVGRFLSGFTGHALVLGYFGMPSPEEAARGLALHGEAACTSWQFLSSADDHSGACVSIETTLPAYRLRLQRDFYLSAGASCVLVEEHLTNLGKLQVDYQWVQHATFGEPLFAGSESQLFLSAKLGKTWPHGYEGKELLISDTTFDWPSAPTPHGGFVDLSRPFVQAETGFVAALRTERERPHGFAAVENQRLSLIAGYVFDHHRFPWIALWEENCARSYAPWNGITKARGVEFGTSPMPTGLESARLTNTLFDAPTFATLPGGETITTSYQLFVSTLPPSWAGTSNLEARPAELRLHDAQGQHLQIAASSKAQSR
jgi:hypothetical protein